jgi:hypothetical protein
MKAEFANGQPELLSDVVTVSIGRCAEGIFFLVPPSCIS